MVQELNKDAKNALNAYNREWRKKHRDKVREINKRYWTKKAGELEKVHTK